MNLDNEFKEKRKRIKIAVAIPHTGWITAGLETRIARWIMNSDYDIVQILKAVKPTVSNRNLIAKEFLESDADFLLTIDSDTVPEKNPLEMVKYDLDIVGGVYPAWKEISYIWLALRQAEDGSFVSVPKEERHGLVEVDGLGAGCLMIKRRVLEDIKTPFIDKLDMEVGNRALGHDMYFCERARAKGYKVWADWNMVCDHLKEIPLISVVNAIEDAFKEGYAHGKEEREVD